jgi:hypothetical protein
MTEPPPSWSSPGGESSPIPPPPAPIPTHSYGYGYAAAQPGVIPLRPLALGELLDGSIKVIRRYPRPTLGLSAAIAVVVTALNIVGVLLLDESARNVSEPGTFDSDQVAAGLAAGGPAQLLAFVAGLVLTGALIIVGGKAVRGQPAPTSEVWAAVKPRLLALLGLSLLTGLIVVAPLVLGIGVAVVLGLALGGAGLAIGIPLGIAGFVAFVYLYIRLSLSSAALVLEKTGVTQALRRSGVLVKGSWWRIFGILLLTWLITAIISGIIVVPVVGVSAVLTSDDSPVYLVLQQLGAGLAAVLLSPFSAGVRALLYVDRRMRAEGLDVALQAAVAEGSAG